MADRGQTSYGGEVVSVLDHSLQSAQRAEADGAPAALVTAALFHDIGWLLAGPGGHEGRGATCLARVFGPGVSEPVRLHVAAKRYRCAIEAEYHSTLSAASIRTLARQGGPLDEVGCAGFEAEPWAPDALRLRSYDDGAKVLGAATADLTHFGAVASRCATG